MNLHKLLQVEKCLWDRKLIWTTWSSKEIFKLVSIGQFQNDIIYLS